MNLSYNIPHLLSEVNTATKAFLDDNSDHVDNQNRRKAIGAVDLLRTALTSPEERILHHSSDVLPTFWHPRETGDGVIEALRGEADPTVRNPTYHATDAAYALPNDSYEHRRLEDQAAGLTEMMHGKLTHAPLVDPAIILDIGCGTGIQTCQFAAKYLNAQVYGIDLSAVPDRNKPPNVEFIQGDFQKLVLKEPGLAANSADYVFNRLLLLGMTDWQKYVNDVASLLKPGGWAEMQDLDEDFYLNGERCSDTWPWLIALRKQSLKRGWDLNCGSNIKSYMERTGLVNIQQKRYRLPFGTWLVDERPETEWIGKHAAREYGMLYHYAIQKMLEGAGYSEEDIRGFQAESKTAEGGFAALDGKEMGFFVTVGMKPEE